VEREKIIFLKQNHELLMIQSSAILILLLLNSVVSAQVIDACKTYIIEIKIQKVVIPERVYNYF
jgi:hypothetical protein